MSEELITGDLQETLKLIAGELAFTDKGVNKYIIDKIRSATKESAKNLKNKEVSLIGADDEDLEVACCVCVVTQYLCDHFSIFVEKQTAVNH